LWPQARALALRAFPGVDIPEQYSPEAWSMADAMGAQLRGDKPKEPIRGRPGDVFLDPETMQPTTTIPEPPKPPGVHTVGRDLVDDTGRLIHRAPDAPRPPKDERLVQVMREGKPVWVRESEAVGQPAAQAARAVTGQERTALAFFNRANQASEDIAPLEERIAKAGIGSQMQLQHAPNMLQTNEQQAYRQAQRAFTEARLRKESGAAIPPAEYENDARTYFAQPGDSPETMEQKRRARQVVLDGLRFGSGKAYDEYYGEPAETPARGRAQGATSSGRGPQPGARRRINGRLAEWDGHGWLPVD